MKTKRFVSLVSAFVASASLVGCARDAGKTPNSAQHSDTHGLYVPFVDFNTFCRY